jgi:hypothetical protein
LFRCRQSIPAGQLGRAKQAKRQNPSHGKEEGPHR